MTTASNTSSPVKVDRLSYAAHSRSEVQAFAVPKKGKVITVDQFWEKLCYSPKEFKQRHLPANVEPKGDFEDYANNISRKFHKTSYQKLPQSLILFHRKETTAPVDHPAGTKCRPDFVASPSTGKGIHWTELEATVEIHSSGTSSIEGPRQAIAYTHFLLQARPDRVSVQGMYVDDKGVILFIASANGVEQSPKLFLTDTHHFRLICAFIRRLYEPHPLMIDPTIKRRKDSNTGQWVFDITLTISKSPSVECRGYGILKAQGSFGQRTHVFVNKENPAIVNSQTIPVIKDQYRDPAHRFKEDELIHHVHNGEEIPGVIHVAHAQGVLYDDGTPVSSGDRLKIRICLVEYGIPLVDLKTPLEVLMAIYDLLEVTRFMYVKRDVLHRDISSGNVLHMERTPKVVVSPSADAKDTEDKFCSIRYLLDPNLRPYTTSTLLVDFDRGEIINSKEKEVHVERVGTVIFMAKAVRGGGPHGVHGTKALYESMPELSEMARATYENIFPHRLARFQHGLEPYFVTIGEKKSVWRHQLYHDAESAYWLLAWWAVYAHPEGANKKPIPNNVWSALNYTELDGRFYGFLQGALHPSYFPLEALLQKVGLALQNDLHWATKKPWSDPEFLHEVFQRHLLNFIFANRDKEFMNLPKANFPRKPDQVTTITPLSTQQFESLRTRSSSTHIGRKRSRSEPQPGSPKKAKKTKKARK